MSKLLYSLIGGLIFLSQLVSAADCGVENSRKGECVHQIESSLDSGFYSATKQIDLSANKSILCQISKTVSTQIGAEPERVVLFESAYIDNDRDMLILGQSSNLHLIREFMKNAPENKSCVWK